MVFQDLPDEFILKSASIICSSKKTYKKADIHIKGSKIECVANDISFEHIKQINVEDFLICPGLINSHTHSAMGFFRDLGHGKKEMIESFLFPAEKSLSSELLKPLSYSYIFGALKSGTTFINDHYYMSDGIAKACETLGIRAGIGETIADLGGAFPETATFENARQKIDNWAYTDKIIPVLAPHATDTVSEAAATKTCQYATKNNIPIHMHLSQTSGEVERTLKRTGKRPVEWAHDVGLLGSNTLGVHLVSINDSDINYLEKTNVTGVVCPSSQIIYETLAPISKLKESKIKLAIATDCAASNDSADILPEVKFASLLDKYLGESKIDHSYWFDSITSTPASALGLDKKIGSIAPGMEADLTFFQKTLDVLPISSEVENLLFSQSSANVKHVMIAGNFVLLDGKPTKISVEEMKEQYIEATKEIKRRCGF